MFIHYNLDLDIIIQLLWTKHLTETMKQFLGQGVFSCGIFVDLQKSFTRVDHYILLIKLEDYGIRGYTKK